MTEISRRTAIKLAAGIATFGSNAFAGNAEGKSPLIRLSVVGKDVFIPDELGNLINTEYSGETRTGKLARVADPNNPELEKKDSPLWQHFKSETSPRTAALPKGKDTRPVVIMVHGFMADPREVINPQNPQRSNNPHDFSFHLNPTEQRHWRHTASWPLGLGMKDLDSGANGLGVAFGSNSQPEIFVDKAERNRVLLKIPLKLGLTANKKIAKAVIDATVILGKFATGLGKQDGQQLFEELDTVLKDIEPELKKIAEDNDFPTYNEVYTRAPKVAPMLIDVIRILADSLPAEQPIDLFCHSLGSRVVIEALQSIAARAAAEGEQAQEFKKLLNRIGRVIFIGGAEHSKNARAMVKTVFQAKCDVGFYNFTSAKDRVLDIFAERVFAANGQTESVIGLRGLEPAKLEMTEGPADWPRKHWFDFELDDDPDPVATKWMTEKRQIKVSGAHQLGVLNHWFYFSSKDNLKVYSHILREREKWDISTLQAELAAFRAAQPK